MAISFTNYVDITSGVAGVGAVRARELILRLFSTNPLIPTNSFAEFTDPDDVATYFGSTSDEYKRAVFYFGFLSKQITAPQKISFSSWVESAVAPNVFGANSASLTALKAINSPHLSLTIGTVSENIGLSPLTGDGSLTAIAASLQTAIRAASSDANWTGATVAYESATNSFNLTGGVVPTSGTVPIAINDAGDPGNQFMIALGWLSVDTVTSYGSAAVSLTDTMIGSAAASTNFATFAFIPDLDEAQDLELATWLNAQNIQYIFLVPVASDTASAISTALMELNGNALTLSPLSTEYPELLPGMILAATDYSTANASQNYMYQPSDLTPSVNNDTDYAAYNAMRVNFYGATQTAGQFISFYQRGVLTGLAVSPSDMNVYANEIWFKSAVADAFLSLLLAVNQVPTNPTGRAMLISTIQSVITVALLNGTFSPGQKLNNSQIQSILSITNDPKAYLQIQTIGYWLDVDFSSSVTIDSRVEWQANYTLIYTKNNAIRKVVGRHVLI